MNRFLLLPSTCACVALLSCSTTVLLTPYASIPTKLLFLASAVIFAVLQAPIQTFGYFFSIFLSNIVLYNDHTTLQGDYGSWLSCLISTNICAIGLFVVCREINKCNILDLLSNKAAWNCVPDVTFMNVNELTMDKLDQKQCHPYAQREQLTSKEQYVKTDFKCDSRGGVQGLVQTTIKPVTFNNRLLGYCKIVTQVQLAQSALYDLFTSIDGSEASYKDLFGHGLDHSRFMLDPAGNIVSWNPGVWKVIGYTRDEVLGQHVSMFYTIDDRVAGRPLADIAIAKSEGHLEVEGWMKRKDGELFWSNVTFTSIQGDNGAVLGLSVVTRDFSDKKKHLDSLHATEEKYQMLVSSVTDYTIIMLDPNGIITTWNAGAQKINGYHAEEVIGKHFSIFYDDEALAERKPEKELEQASSEGRFEEEGWRVKKDGTRFYANVVLSAIYNSHKDIVGFSKVTRDITERMKTQAALRASEERFQLLISCVKDYSIFMLDPDGKIASWNSGAQRIKGYDAEEAIGKHFSIMYTPEDCGNGKPQNALMIASTEGRYEDEGLRVRKDGTTFWANVIITAMRDSTGRLVGYSKVTRDVTDRRQTDLALRSAMQSAQAAALAKQSFLAMMSHEIRTPLHAVITLSLLLQNSDLDPMQRDYLETIHNSSKQLLGIINDILDFSKIESGKMDLVLKPFNLRQCIEEIIDLVLLKPCTGKATNHIDVVYILAPEVPEHIVSDTVRVRQILMNYLSNAVKFTAKGEVVVRLSCDPKDYQEGDSVMLTFSVHDTGIGIKSECLEDLFQPFFQIEAGATAQIYGGTGLGLVISKKLSQLMGGNVWVESEEGMGSTFYFSIQAKVGSTPVVAISPRSPNSSFEFLVVDSSPSGSEALFRILQRNKCQAFRAHDYASALALAHSHSRLSAVFITREFNHAHPEYASLLRGKCKAVFLTGTPDSLDYHSSAIPSSVTNASAFHAFLAKPFRMDTVRNILRMLRGKLLTISRPLDSSSPLASPVVSPISNLRILVAEDNAVNRKVAQRILERLGYLNVDMVENGKEVLEAIENKVYDVILMDIQMPVMDGWTASAEIFKRYPEGKRPNIIAMTAYAYEHDQQRCAQLGMKAHIAKPVDMTILADILRSCSV